jgi:hypothetical protein
MYLLSCGNVQIEVSMRTATKVGESKLHKFAKVGRLPLPEPSLMPLRLTSRMARWRTSPCVRCFSITNARFVNE